MIEGIKISPKKKIHDERGAIFHMLRNDDSEFEKFGEIYFSKVFPGVVKGWHIHSKMTLNYLVVVGSIKLALFDDRTHSPTKGKLQELILDDVEGKLIRVPPGIWNGFQGLGKIPAIVANCATEPHDPDEILRRPFSDTYFPQIWEQK